MDEFEADDDLDESEYPDDDDSDETVPCPYCREPVYEDAERCPRCGHYLSREDAPRRRPWWLVAGVVLCLTAVAWWVVRG
jgi:uncharacterized paraquat-inducible protein A